MEILVQYLPSSSWDFNRNNIHICTYACTSPWGCWQNHQARWPLQYAIKKMLSISPPHISLICVVQSLFQRVHCSVGWTSIYFFKELPLKCDLDGSTSKCQYCTCHSRTNNICAWMRSRHCFLEKQHFQAYHKSHGACECQILGSRLKLNSEKWKITSRHGAPSWFHQQLRRGLCCVCSGKHMKYLSLMKMRVLEHASKWWSNPCHSRRALALSSLWMSTQMHAHIGWSSNMYASKLTMEVSASRDLVLCCVSVAKAGFLQAKRLFW